jgi:hypothetical protein
MIDRHAKPSPDQLTLHLGPVAFGNPPCFNRHRRHQVLHARAQWWFSQMRRKVEDTAEVKGIDDTRKHH